MKDSTASSSEGRGEWDDLDPPANGSRRLRDLLEKIRLLEEERLSLLKETRRKQSLRSVVTQLNFDLPKRS